MDYSKGNSLSEHYSWRGSNYCSRSNSKKDVTVHALVAGNLAKYIEILIT